MARGRTACSKEAARHKMRPRANKQRLAKRARQKKVTEVPHRRESTRQAIGIIKPTFEVRRKLSSDGATRAPNKNGAPVHPMRRPAIRNPRTELEAATQRFVDLYDFAPIAYVSFDRAGRIEEANLAATELLGVARDLLIGRPFAFYVADLDSFLQHLLHCRTRQEQVATELNLKPRKG